MKKILHFLLAFTFLTNTTYSQGMGGSIMDHGGNRNPFTTWETFYLSGPLNLRVQISYAMLKGCDPKLHNQGYSYWRINNSTAREKCWLKFKFDYSMCDGSISTSSNEIDLSKEGILNYRDNWIDGAIRIVKGPYDIKLEDYNQPPKTVTDDQLDTDLKQRTQKYNLTAPSTKKYPTGTLRPAVIGDRADNGSPSPQVETMASTNSSYQQQQAQQNQQQTQSLINSSQNTTDPITQALYIIQAVTFIFIAVCCITFVIRNI